MHKPGTYLVVVADQNDADFVTRIIPITLEQLIKIMPVIQAIKEFEPYEAEGMNWTHNHNWPSGEYLPRTDLGEKYPHEIYPQVDQKLIEFFSDEYVPYGQYGIHTIESIDLITVSDIKHLI